MTPADRKQFVEIVLGFAELKGKQLSAPALELYWRALQHWTIEEFRDAAEHLLRSCEFMPTPKDFEGIRRAGRMTPGEAWESLSTRNASDLARRALDMATGGRYFGHLDIEREVPHVHRRFLEIYRELDEVEQVRESVPQLAGSPRRTAIGGPKKLGQLLPKLDA